MNCSLFTSLLHPKVIKWDIFINKLKEPTEVPDKELKELWKRERNMEKLLTIYNLTRSSNTAHYETQWQPLKSPKVIKKDFRKILRDIDDIFEHFAKTHSVFLNPVAYKSPDEQSLSQCIIDPKAAAKVKHLVRSLMMAAGPRSKGTRTGEATKKTLLRRK